MRSLLCVGIALSVLCAASSARAYKCPSTLPVLFIVQDKSGSMGDSPDPSCGSCASKWDSSTTAVTDLTTKFSSRFDFGLEFFPADSTSCSAGTVVASVPSTASAIHSAYNNASPGGATPMAISLDSARTYLVGKHLSVPAYVLLITDGLPNCNGALNPNTCAWSATGCTPSICSAGDCLDDAATKAAAGRLFAANFPVYVVGFGATAQSNQTVLNGIAASGGTTHAYTATDEASLSTALDTIAAQVANCCMDVCTAGISQCDPNGNPTSCVYDPAIDCTIWQFGSCSPGYVCSGGACVPCNNQCTLGQFQCSGGGTVQKCVAGAGGCTVWQNNQDCGYGEKCVSGACSSCSDCSGSTRCVDDHYYQSCDSDWWTGCSGWSGNKACPNGQTCQGNYCAPCNATCTLNAKDCDGNNRRVCQADGYGCTSWVVAQVCTDFCSGGQCGACGTTCTPGTKQCSSAAGGVVQQCSPPDAHNCTNWLDHACPAAHTCSNGDCLACPPTCTPGATVCVGNDVYECDVQPSGCYSLGNLKSCAAGEVCTSGACTKPCVNDCADGATKCGGGVPYTCAKAPNGCWVWQTGTACVAPKVCAAGGCRDACSGGEIETCSAGYICTTLPEGKLCVPTAVPPDAGSVIPGDFDAGGLDPGDEPDAGKTGKRPDAGTPGTSGTGGCSCSAASAAPLALLWPLALLLARRRRTR